MDLALVIPAFIAGIITFLAPCTLPIVPGYLAFISGADLSNPEQLKASRKKIVLNGLFFTIGFSIVFIIFGVLAGLLGSAIAPIRGIFTRVGGAFVIAFGLWMMGILNLPFLNTLNVEKRLKLKAAQGAPSPLRSLILGASFGFGWTPCVGPILASILLLTTVSSTAFQGGILLFVFSLGLAIPFLLIAYAIGSANTTLVKFSPYLKWVGPVGGFFLILLGLLLITDNFILLINYGFEIFRFINYESLQNFL